MPPTPLTPGSTIYDSQGRPLRLAAEIGKGGEGSVWEVAGLPDRVAKLYHRPTAEQSAKLGAMLALSTERLQKIAAWPLATLHGPRGAVQGFVMPRASGQQIHVLYGPKSRLAHFPRSTWPFLLQAAANLARAFAVVHESGLVVGDVNHGNSLVSDQATVALIDCDSFQIPNGGQPFYCGVGVETHVPPELQGRDLSRLPRTVNHDAFGLAVLLFQILFMGRHPFSGRFLGSGDMPIPRSIAELRFAYGPGAAARQMQQPPNTLPLSALSRDVAWLFERAFSAQGMKEGRPAAREWVAALEALGKDLRVCDRSPAHHYLRPLSACPWCELESRAGVLLFWVNLPSPAPGGPPGTAGPFQLALVWARIVSVPHPGAAPALPAPGALHPTPSPVATHERRQRRQRRILGVILGSAGAVGSLWAGSAAFLLLPIVLLFAWGIYHGGSHAVRDQARLELRVAQEELQRLAQAWKSEASPASFETQLRELEQKRAAYLGLPAARQRGLDQLQSSLRQKQLDRFLDGHRLERAKIKGIGPARRATLQSFGIETAADVDRGAITRIPGFGPVMAQSLVDWRQALERAFVFDPTRGIDPADLRALDAHLALQRAQLERELGAGAPRLDQLRRTIAARRQTLQPLLTAATAKVAQVEADLRGL